MYVYSLLHMANCCVNVMCMYVYSLLHMVMCMYINYLLFDCVCMCMASSTWLIAV